MIVSYNYCKDKNGKICYSFHGFLDIGMNTCNRFLFLIFLCNENEYISSICFKAVLASSEGFTDDILRN